MIRIDLPTAQKIAIARGLSSALLLGRRLLGQSDPTALVTRRGLRWSLDLTQGIDLAIYLFGQFERSTARALQRLIRPQMIAIDVGSNVGAHTLPMARAVGPEGRVIAADPSEWALDKLATNLALNPQLRETVTLVHAALGDGVNRQEEFCARWSLHDEDPVHPVHHGTRCPMVDQRQTTLDQLVVEQQLSTVDLIKLDVDGAELAVLRGAEQTLRRHRPLIIMEVTNYLAAELGYTLEELLDRLHRAGYSLFDERNGRPLPMDEAGLKRLLPEGGGFNVVAAVDQDVARLLDGGRWSLWG